MKFKFFIVIIVCFLSCKKEPKKGEYKGVFNGKLETDTSITNYTTVYYFDITHSTKKEFHIKEKLSQITSILKKHEKDSTSGMIGFGGIYQPNTDTISFVRFNTVSIQGKYDKKTIIGTFSTTFGDVSKEYLSEGSFTMSAY
jgi:NRPS condensation-like uncharacterized protein